VLVGETIVDLRITGIKACAFDAYGTLFDVNSAASQAKDDLGDRWQPLAELWRAKQLQYTWLRGLMGRHADFWQVKANGFRVLWCNRFGQAPERIPERPDGEIRSLAVLPEIVGV